MSELLKITDFQSDSLSLNQSEIYPELLTIETDNDLVYLNDEHRELLIKVLQTKKPILDPLKVGDVVYRSEDYESVVVFIGRAGWVVTEDTDDHALDVIHEDVATRRRDELR